MLEVRNFVCFAIGSTLTEASKRFSDTFPTQSWDFLLVKDGSFHCRKDDLVEELESLKEYPNLFKKVSALLV